MRGALLTAAVVAAASAVLFGSTLYGGFPLDVSHGGDVYSLSALYDRFAHYLGEGEYPWYFPEFGSGSPVAAAWMYGLFSPATLLFLLLPAGPAWVWSGILHFALAAFGLHLLARELGMRPAAAAVAGIVYALSEWMVGRALCGHLNLVWPAAWAPLVFFAASRAAAGRARAIPALGIILGLAILSGHVQVWFYVGPVLLAFTIAEIRRHGRWHRAFASLAAGCVLALGIAAVQWSFTVEYFSALGDISVPAMQHPVFTTPSIVMAAKPFPGFLGQPPDTWNGGKVFFQESLAVGGLGVLLLAGLGLADRRRGRFFWFAVLLLGLLIAGGYRNVISSALNHLPVLSSGRAAGRALHLAVLAIAMLAGRGVDSWLDPEARPSLRRVGVVVAALLLLAAGCLVILRVGLGNEEAFAQGLPAVGMSVLSAAVIVGGLLLVRRCPRAGIALPAGALVAVLIAGLPPIRAVGDDFYTRDPFEVLPEQARTQRLMLSGWGSFPVIEQHGLRTARPILPVDTEWYGRLLETGSPMIQRWLGIGVHIEMTNASKTLLDPVAPPPRVKLLVDPMPPGMLFANALGDVPDEDAARRLAEGEFALLLPDPAPPLEPGEAVVRREGVDVEETRPGLLRLRTRAARSRWLYVSEKFYADWRAAIDGEVVVIHRANVAGMAVTVPAGEHEVEFSYRPDCVAWGPALSLFSLLFALSLLILRLRRRTPQEINPAGS